MWNTLAAPSMLHSSLPPKTPGRAIRFVLAATLVASATALAKLVHALLPVPDLEMLYLLAVMIAAVKFGRGPSILAAALAVASYDFFFVPPFFTFQVANARYFLTFAMMFGVGFLLSELTARLRQQEREAIVREERTAALYALSRELGAADDASAAAEVIARHAADVFAATAWVLHGHDAADLRVLSTAPKGEELESRELDVARSACESGKSSDVSTGIPSDSSILCLLLEVGGNRSGVIALRPREPAHVRAIQQAFLQAFVRQASFAFERARLTQEAQSAALRASAEEMRSSLLSAVSHDLRTPLAAITGAATSLRDDTHPGEMKAELLETICEEAERLERLVGNLLDMTRLESGKVALKREWVPVEEMVGSALTRLERVLGDRGVRLDLPATLPLLSVDPVLFEQVLVNLVENAAKYGNPGSSIEIAARSDAAHVRIEVRDRGPGLPPGGEERIFEKFYRGPHHGVAGAGLGLPICRAILEAHGAALHATNRAGSGAVFTVTVPLAGSVPPVMISEPME